MSSGMETYRRYRDDYTDGIMLDGVAIDFDTLRKLRAVKRGQRSPKYLTKHEKLVLQKLPKRPRAYIYVIAAGNDVYKIGYAIDPSSRLLEIQIGSPVELRIVMSFQVKNGPQVESDLHNYFRIKHVRGEWFRLNSDDLEYIRQYLGQVP